MKKKEINPFIRQAFAASILRLFHQIYEKMLNYINLNVYLLKMVPLKWSVGDLGMYGVIGVWGVYWDSGGWYGERGRHPHTGKYLPIEVVHASHLLCGVLIGEGSANVWGGLVVKLCYLSWSDGISCNTSSHMCGRWYFLKFSLSERSLTQMYMASFMFLMTPSIHLSTIVKHLGLTGCSVEWLWWCMGDQALRCSFSLSLKVLPDSPMHSSGQLICGHLNLYMTPLLWSLLSLSLGAMRRVLMVLLPLKGTWIPKLLHVF